MAICYSFPVNGLSYLCLYLIRKVSAVLSKEPCSWRHE